MASEKFLVITFRKTHDVMEAEERLESAGIRPRLIPVPEQASPDCTAAIRIPFARNDEARTALAPMSEKIGKWIVEADLDHT